MKILGDSSLSAVQKSQLLLAVESLDSSKMNQLKQLVSTVAGAGVGAAVMRFLFGTGRIGTIGGGIFGALVGSRLGPNAGTMMQNSVDFFGRPF